MMKIIQSEEFLDLNPLVSVVIPSYNRAETLGETLDSILSQVCSFDFEIVIGDDSSSDNSRDILLQYQQKHPLNIKLLFHEKNMGLGSNWAICVQQCKGKYVTNCDNDDYWHNIHKLQIQVDYMESHLNCGLLHTDYDELDIVSHTIIHSYRAKSKEQILQGYRQKEIFNGQLKIVSPTICFRKELFDKYIPVDRYIELNFPIEDWPTWLILSKYSEVDYLAISTATYRVGHESLSNLESYNKVLSKFTKEKVMYKFLCDMFPDDLEFVEEDYNKHVDRVLFNIAFKKNDFKITKKYGQKLKKQGVMNLKIVSSSNVLMFYLFSWLRRIKIRWSSLFLGLYFFIELSSI